MLCERLGRRDTYNDVVGGDDNDLLTTFGGNYPPHIRPDVCHPSLPLISSILSRMILTPHPQPVANLIRCDDRVPPLYADAPDNLAPVLAVTAMAHGKTSWESPVPRASWDHEDFKNRVAYIRTLRDAAIPLNLQQMMIEGTGVEWVIRDVDCGHSAQLARAEEVVGIVEELVRGWVADLSRIQLA
jgi:hypothetical protein